MTSSGQAFAVQQPQTQTLNAATSIPQHQPSSVPSQQTIPAPNVSAKVSSSNTKESDKNLALAIGLVNCYNAFVAGDLPPQLSFADLDQIHPEDVEEMDITWQIAMAVFRAKQFAKKTGKNNKAMNADKKEDQIQALNITGSENAHLAQIDDAASKNNDTDPEAEMMELQFALMVSTSSEPKKSERQLDAVTKELDELKIKSGKTDNETDREPHHQYGKPAGFVSRGFINIESTNVSTSSADTPLDQAKCEAGESVSVFNSDFSIVNKFECVSDDKTEKAPCVSSSLDNVEFNFFDMLSKPNKAQPRSVSSKSNSRSSTNFGRKSRRSMQTPVKSISKSSETVVKPKLQWKPKSLSSSSLPPSKVIRNEDPNLQILKSKSEKGQLWRNIVRPWYVDSGCSRHMTGDISQLSEIQSFNGGYVSFAGGDGGKITLREIVTNGVLSFENVNFAPELKHSLLSVSQICDKGYSTHFTDKSV
ncbi:uncharacterized protein LOC128132926 [Lactuca sativa]|uniref:uncharacterized protein LOC128132926 n=1 Tax=Lactuca sativa TaxID=4236 RepID=UPI0022AECC38|nr:uncharacterized protein LOC128132926 [Lactuca sativa]